MPVTQLENVFISKIINTGGGFTKQKKSLKFDFFTKNRTGEVTEPTCNTNKYLQFGFWFE